MEIDTRNSQVVESSPSVCAPKVNASARPKRWGRTRVLWWAAGAVAAILAGLAVVLQDDVRTLRSLRRVRGTNAFVMDYYVDYHMEEIRRDGMDVHNIEDSCLSTFFPDFVLPIARAAKRSYIPQEIKTVEDKSHHCSTVALRSTDGTVLLGRNFDYSNDACLIVRIRDSKGVASIAVIDLAYLNLNRADLDKTSLLDRIPLLFAPYYVMDGMNRHGLAVSLMSVEHAEPPVFPGKPDVIQPTLMRLMLDYATTTDEAVALAREYNVHFVGAPLHIMVADATGQFRIIEYLNGELRVTTTDQQWQVCTNDIVCGKTEPEKDAACNRYRAGSDLAEQVGEEGSLAEVRRIAKSMSNEKFTMWTSLYNLTTREAFIAYKANYAVEYRDFLMDANVRNSH